MNTKSTYTLMEGEGISRERLTILNECYNPFALGLLQQIDLSGKTILEVACGVGLLACGLARLVGPKGKIIATDISEKQLAIASENAQKQNLHNIEFVECSAFELDKLKIKVDCIYSRFLLAHLNSPEVVLKQELNCLKPGGYLICSEPPFAYDTMYCYPKSDVFDQIKKIHISQTKVHNTDFSIGAKLPYLLKGFGTSFVYSYIGQPILSTPREKELMRLGIVEIADQLILKGLITKRKIEQLSKEIKLFENEKHIVGYVASMETCVKKT